MLPSLRYSPGLGRRRRTDPVGPPRRGCVVVAIGAGLLEKKRGGGRVYPRPVPDNQGMVAVIQAANTDRQLYGDYGAHTVAACYLACTGSADPPEERGASHCLVHARPYLWRRGL